MAEVAIREVGLRDGLQMVRQFLDTDRKLEWFHAETQTGVREFEVTSFVPPRIMPQFRDAADVVQGARQHGVVASALVPNVKGAQFAFNSGVSKINFVLSASEAHNVANVRRTTDESLEAFRQILGERSGRGVDVPVAGGIATAFGCTLQGNVPETRVHNIVDRLLEAGADELIVADTVGYANPTQVKRILSRVTQQCGPVPVFAHFHDTRGTGLANVVAALEAGVRRFDASLGGLGGCPFAPGATGNINIEDCAYLIESLGLKTGIDIEALVALRRTVEGWLPEEAFYGAIARAGLPRTFSRAV